MKTIKIKAYQYDDLCRDSQIEVMFWLDEYPMQYEDENGIIQIEYFSDQSDELISDHCNANGYLFNQYGQPVHHLR